MGESVSYDMGKLGLHQKKVNSSIAGIERPAGAVSRKPRKHFGPVKPLQNLDPCDYRAVLFTHSKDEEKFPASCKKFQA